MSCRRHPQIDCLVLSAGKKVDHEGVDLVGCFPHRDVTALLDDVKRWTPLIKGRPYPK